MRKLILGSSLLIITGLVFAQGSAAERKKPAQESGHGMARQTEGHKPQDSNGDGKITRDEWPGDDTSFKQLDRNGDGALTKSDRQLRTNRKAVHRHPAPKK